MANTTATKELRVGQSKVRRLKRTFSLRFSPEHLDILRQRAFDLSIPCTDLLRILLEVEIRDGIARREILDRLNQGNNLPRALVQRTNHT